MAQRAERLVGRADELGRIDARPRRARRGPAGAARADRRARHRQDAPARRARAAADERGYIVLSGSGVGARARPAVLGLRRRARRVRARPRAAPARSARTMTCAPSSPRCFRRSPFRAGAPRPRGPPRALSRLSRRVRAARAASRRRRPLVLILDDLHWADPASVELLGALLQRPPAAPVLLAFAIARGQISASPAAALQRARARGAFIRIELGALTRNEAGELLLDRSATWPPRALRGHRRQPVLPEQLARSLGRRTRPRRRNAATRASSGFQVPSSVAAALTEELGLLSPAARRLLEGSAVAGDPFDPELAAAAAGAGRRRPSASRRAAADSTCARRRRCRAASASATRSSGAPSTRARPVAGGWLRTSAPRRARRARGLGAARAHHVEQSARLGDRAAIAVLREAGEAAAQRAPGHRGALVRAAPCGCCPRARPRRSGSASCSHRQMRWRRSATSARAARCWSSASASSLRAGARAAADHRMRERRAPARAATTMRMRACARPSRPPGPTRRSRRGPDDRARRGRLLPGASRADGGMGDTCRGGRAARLGDVPLTAAAVALLSLAHAGRQHRRGRAPPLRGSGARRRAARRGARTAARRGLEPRQHASSTLDRLRSVAHARRARPRAGPRDQPGSLLPEPLHRARVDRDLVEARFADAEEILDGAIEAARLRATRRGSPGCSSTAPAGHDRDGRRRARRSRRRGEPRADADDGSTATSRTAASVVLARALVRGGRRAPGRRASWPSPRRTTLR